MAKARGTGGGYVKVEGINELRRSLKAIEDATTRKGLQQTLKSDFREAANIVTVAAKQRAPLGPKRAKPGPGALRDTIRPKGALRGATVQAGGIRGVTYAGPIHWGWPTRPNASKGWRGGPIKARPFLYQALIARQHEIADRMRRTVVKLTEQVEGL